MLFSFQELKKIAKLPKNISVENVVEAINQIGFEVEDYYLFSDLQNLKFGKITKIIKNPQANHLNVCTIEFIDKTRIIQTGADNVFVGMIVVACVPGSRLGKRTIVAKEIYGIVSEGMMTELPEFGIDNNLVRPELQDKITHYDNVNDLSINPISFLALDDYMIDVSLLSNRSDAACYYIMALELSAYFKTEINLPLPEQGNRKATITVEKNKNNHLTLLSTEVNFNISIKEQIFLAKHQIKSINDSTDLTNLTLLYSGQPTHAYDQALVGAKFSVQNHSGQVKVLGNKLVELDNALVVTSNNKVVSVASVIGLANTSTSNNTKQIILELGRFEPFLVRNNSKNVKLSTQASIQGSKNLSWGTTKLALAYLTSKLKTYSNFVNYQPQELLKIKFNVKELNKLVGQDITNDPKYFQALEALKILGFKKEHDVVTIPDYRHDIQTMQDLCEEILRFYGYNNLAPQPAKISPLKVRSLPAWEQQLVAQGYQEVRTYALIDQTKNIFDPFDFSQKVRLLTFPSNARSEIRNSQTNSLWEIATYHQKRKINDFNFFSLGMINQGIETLAIASSKKSFQNIKQDLVNIFGFLTFKVMKNENYHPGISATIYQNNNLIGFIGAIHPKLENQKIIFAEILINNLSSSKKISFKNYDNSPLEQEDITISLKKHESIAKYINHLTNFNIKVIDRYQDGENLKITIRVSKKRSNHE